MVKLFIRAYVFLTTIIVYCLLGYYIYSFFDINMRSLNSISVTTINVIASIFALPLGSIFALGGVMANDSGKGGFFTLLFQFLSITYLFVYFIGLVSSISVLYSDMENKKEIARWLASMSLIQLSLIVVLLAVGLLYEKYEERSNEEYDERDEELPSRYDKRSKTIDEETRKKIDIER